MKQPRITRRQFFKASAFGVGSLALSSVALATVVAAPSKQARAEAEQPQKLAIPQPTFISIASTTVFGPPTDLSAGWDGTLWAIDASGAPHLYDPTTDTWNAYGEGIEAATAIGNTLYVFRGGYYITVDLTTNTVTGGPTSVAATWPSLPDSFKLRVTGATSDQLGKLVLLNGGWYVYADGSQPPKKLTDLIDWPKTPNWADGLVDAVYAGEQLTYLLRGNQYIAASLYAGLVIQGPQPVTDILPPSLATKGTDAATFIPVSRDTCFFHGTSVVAVPPDRNQDRTYTYYLPKLFSPWPATWHPVLNHAPSGRMGNLWCTTTAQGQDNIVQHDGENWNTIPGRGPSIAIGQDNSVYVVSGDNQTIDTLVVGKGWVATATAPVQLTKVAVGDDDHVFVLGNDNSVHRLVQSSGTYSYTTVSLGAGVPNPTHMAANADGTLWHCNSANANAQRLISEASAPSATIPVKNSIVTGVLKVASTGFGAAHCLVTQSGQSQPQVYRYDSPYIFKTARDYAILGNGSYGALGDETGGTIAQGLGNLYFVQYIAYVAPGLSLTVRFIALDAHTGREVASYAPPAGIVQYTGLVFDPINELIYVGTAPLADQPDQTVPGQLIALDARTLAVKWTFPTAGGIDAVPTLSGTRLCFGDRTNTLYLIDTRAALAAAKQSQPITSEWTWVVPTRSAVTHRMSSPVITDGKVCAVAWDLVTVAIGGNALGYYHYLAICDAATGLNGSTRIGDFVEADDNRPLAYQFIVSAPVLGKVRAKDKSDADAIYVNDGFSLYVHCLDTTKTPIASLFPLQPLSLGQISTGFAYDDGSRIGPNGLSSNGLDPLNIRLWFGDSFGNLWSFDHEMRPAIYTPKSIASNTRIVTTPVLYKDPQGGMTVLIGVLDSSGSLQPSLYGFDPENGNIASVPTGVTGITALTAAVTNGLVYAGGVFQVGDSPKQVFGIRVDKLPQGLRDFVIESQMMQDPDPNSPNGDPANNVPPSFARYQTHLTVVDDQKNPQIHEPVKIWCDTPNTAITVDGQLYSVGPDDASFAAVKTGADGSLVITMDATDYFAPTLRVWASFMDPFERIVVNPDAEFHRRVMTAHANASDDDPDKVNLQTATNYKGTSLFTADEKNQNPSQPQNVANSIQQLNTGLGLSSTNSKGMYRKLMRAMGVKHKNQRISVKWIDAGTPSPDLIPRGGEADPPDKYMAYADLPGATHFPTNIPAARLVSIIQPVGLSFSRPNGDASKAPTFTALSHADARAAIDGLKGEAWKPNDPQGGSVSRITPTHTLNTNGAFNIWQDFWNWLKGLLDKVLQCILSIGEDILAGIQYVVDDVLKVFKAIIKVLDDVFPFLGSFFKMLEKLVDDVMMALSALFNFGEIIKTHNFLRGELLGRMQQIKSTITSQIAPAVDSFFKEGEAAIVGFFNQLRGQLAPNQSMNGLHGMGSTAHSAYRVNTPGGGTSSQAVRSSWATQKLKAGLGSALGRTSTTNARPASTADDPIADFITAFLNRITGDGDLSAAFGQLQNDIRSLLHPSSATQFFSTLFTTLLDILETLLVSVLAVGNALADGLLAVVGDVIDALFDSQNGLLVAQLDVPILSWLYQQLFGEPLSFVNVILLVAAIPVTMIYRVGFGRYPSQDLALASALAIDGAERPQQTTDAAKVIGIVVGLFSGIGTIIGGVVNCLAALDNKAPPTIGKVSLAISGLLAASSFPIADIKKPDAYDLAEFGLGLVGLGLGLVGLITFEGAIKQLLDVLMPFLNSLNNIGLLVMYSVQAAKEGITNDWQFAAGVISTFPGLLDPLRLIEEVGEIILGVVVGVAGFAVGALDLVAALTTINELDPRPHRRYFPFVPHSPQPVAAHP